MRCPSCDHDNRPDRRFCTECGATLAVACPSCGRTKFDLPTVLNQVRSATKHLVGLDIAVMGCIVNGPGEMADADYGYVGKGGGLITLYRKRDPIKTVPQEQGVAELVALIQADGKCQEPTA